MRDVKALAFLRSRAAVRELTVGRVAHLTLSRNVAKVCTRRPRSSSCACVIESRRRAILAEFPRGSASGEPWHPNCAACRRDHCHPRHRGRQVLGSLRRITSARAPSPICRRGATIAREAYGHESLYLTADDGGEIVGVLPLVVDAQPPVRPPPGLDAVPRLRRRARRPRIAASRRRWSTRRWRWRASARAQGARPAPVPSRAAALPDDRATA